MANESTVSVNLSSTLVLSRSRSLSTMIKKLVANCRPLNLKALVIGHTLVLYNIANFGINPIPGKLTAVLPILILLIYKESLCRGIVYHDL